MKVIVGVKFHAFAYISAIIGPILTNFRPQRWHPHQQQKAYGHLTLEM